MLKDYKGIFLRCSKTWKDKTLKIKIYILNHESQAFEFETFFICDANKSDLQETMIMTEGETILFHQEVYTFC